MEYYWSDKIGYHVGGKTEPDDVECSKRPSMDYKYSNGNWILDATLQKQNQTKEAQKELMISDSQMIRVIEDLISTLIEKKVIALTDLPKAVIEKLETRKVLRDKMK